MSTQMEVDEATELFLDAFLALADGKDDDDVIFLDHHLRAVAEHLNLAADWPEVEPIKAGEFRQRYRAAKAAIAQGDGPRA